MEGLKRSIGDGNNKQGSTNRRARGGGQGRTPEKMNGFSSDMGRMLSMLFATPLPGAHLDKIKYKTAKMKQYCQMGEKVSSKILMIAFLICFFILSRIQLATTPGSKPVFGMQRPGSELD